MEGIPMKYRVEENEGVQTGLDQEPGRECTGHEERGG